jgi:hypothetical protein
MNKLLATLIICAVTVCSTVIYKDYQYKKVRIDGSMKAIEREFLLDLSFLDVKKTKFTHVGQFDHYTVIGFQHIADKTVPVIFDCAIDNRIRKIHCFREVE